MLNTLFTGDTIFFSVPAIAGTFFFLVRLLLNVSGIADMDGHDIGHGGIHDGGADHGDLGHAHTADADAANQDSHHSTQIFKYLSVQSIAAFMMGFGWAGLGGLHGGPPLPGDFGTALLCGIAGGIGMVWLLTWLLKLVHDLQSSGTVSIMQAINAEGEVYVTVPEHGKGSGQVKVVIKDRQRIYNAVSESDALPTNTRIKVARVNENNTLTVTKV